MQRFKALLTKLSLLGVLVSVAGVPLALLIGRPLLTLIYRPEYGNHVVLLALLVGAAGLSTVGSFLLCGASAARAFRAQVPVYTFGLLLAAVGSALLVPRYGINGAGMALLLSAASIALGGLLVVRNVLNFQLN
jgi:O-antigen/teichoic acid export membrane protein